MSAAYLEQCDFVVAEGSPVKSITPAELAKAYTSDPQAAKEKYHDQYVSLTGRVKQLFVEDEPTGFHLTAQFSLEGDGQIDIPVNTKPVFERMRFASLKVGDTVELLGQCTVRPQDGKHGIGISLCERIDDGKQANDLAK
jgi:hypothetical protein